MVCASSLVYEVSLVLVLIVFGIPVVVALPAIFPENKITSSVRCALLYSIIIICLLEMLQTNSLATFTLKYLDMDRKSIHVFALKLLSLQEVFLNIALLSQLVNMTSI